MQKMSLKRLTLVFHFLNFFLKTGEKQPHEEKKVQQKQWPINHHVSIANNPVEPSTTRPVPSTTTTNKISSGSTRVVVVTATRHIEHSSKTNYFQLVLSAAPVLKSKKLYICKAS
jgi:hypothetical protein